jgi:hypothetical protein
MVAPAREPPGSLSRHPGRRIRTVQRQGSPETSAAGPLDPGKEPASSTAGAADLPIPLRPCPFITIAFPLSSPRAMLEPTSVHGLRSLIHRTFPSPIHRSSIGARARRPRGGLAASIPARKPLSLRARSPAPAGARKGPPGVWSLFDVKGFGMKHGGWRRARAAPNVTSPSMVPVRDQVGDPPSSAGLTAGRSNAALAQQLTSTVEDESRHKLPGRGRGRDSCGSAAQMRRRER